MRKTIIPVIVFMMMVVSAYALPINSSINYTVDFQFDDFGGTATNGEFPIDIDLNFDGYNETIIVCRDGRDNCPLVNGDVNKTVKITLSQHRPINASDGLNANLGDDYALFFVLLDSNDNPIDTQGITGNISNNLTPSKFAYLSGDGSNNFGGYVILANQLTLYGVEFDPLVYTTKNTNLSPKLQTQENFTMGVTATDQANVTYLYRWFKDGVLIPFESANTYEIDGSVGEGIYTITVETNNLYTQVNDSWTVEYYEGYLSTYGASDIAPIVADGVGNFLIAFVIMSGAIVFGYIFIKFKKT